MTVYYHGTTVEGILEIRATPILYLTDNRAYALFYIMDKDINHVTCGVKDDGIVHYKEQFPAQIEKLYSGKSGYLYTVANGNFAAGKSRGIVVSEKAVPVVDCEFISDVYAEILKCETSGEIVVRRYEDLSNTEKHEYFEMYVKYIIKNKMLNRTDIKTNFIKDSFPESWSCATELSAMEVVPNGIQVIQSKDGVSVWRVSSGDDSYVMKYFDKPEYCREIANYQLLNSLGVPTLKVIAHTDCSLLIEDIERSVYRLGTAEDMNDPGIAEKVALWYKTLHQNGREYLKTHDFIDEYDCLTMDNLKLIQDKTGTSGLRVWKIIEDNFEQIRSTVMDLPRTLVYTDFYYTNLAVARDGTSALVFDYNFFYKSYVYSDIRNVCSSLGDEAKAAFLSVYGGYDEREVMIDNVVSHLYSLHIACQHEVFPDWAKNGVEQFRDGSLLDAVEKLLEVSRV